MTRTRRRTLRGRGKASAPEPADYRQGIRGPKSTTSPAPVWTEEERRKAREKFQRDMERNHEKASRILEPLVINRRYKFTNTLQADEGSIGTLTSKGDTSVNFNINRVNYHIANPWDYTFEYAPHDEADALSDHLSGLTLTPHLVPAKRGSSRRRRHTKPRTRGRTA